MRSWELPPLRRPEKPEYDLARRHHRKSYFQGKVPESLINEIIPYVLGIQKAILAEELPHLALKLASKQIRLQSQSQGV